MTRGSSRRPAARGWLAVLSAVLVVVAPAGSLAQPGPAQPDAAAGEVVWEDLPPTWPAPQPVTATAYVLMDADTGQILAAREPDRRLVVASTVKVLTVLTALDHVTSDTVVTAGDEVLVGGAGVGFDPGETWPIEDVLEAILVRSGNDAARALAVHVGGSISGFVRLMQAKAADLGLQAPVIEDPSGLDDSNRLSARDLAAVTRAAMQDDRFRDVAARAAVDLPSLGTVETRNLLLERYAGAIGVKTGYTDLAGWCLIGAAERDGRELITVVLDARTDEDRFADTERLLDFGFQDHVTVPAPSQVRVRQAGGWHRHVQPVEHVWFPDDLPGRVDVMVPLEPAESVMFSATWDERPLGQWATQSADGAGHTATSVGGRLTDAMYRAMRSAHRGGLWTDNAGVGG